MFSKIKIYLRTHSYFLVGLLFTLILLWPLTKEGYFTHHDDVQVIRLHQMDQCIKDLQIPCRWVPDLGGGYGYPLFNYYAPLPYYIGEIFLLLTNNLIYSAKLMFAVSFVGAYVFMYLLASKLWGKAGGALSAVFYSYAPYHAADLYIRGAMGEMWALMLFPAVFWAYTKLQKNISYINIVLSAILLAALITSHNLSAMLFVPLVLIYVFALYLKDRNIQFLKFSLVSVLLAFVLSAFYWIPALAEKNLVHVDSTTVGYFSYTEHFKGLRKLFFEQDWNWGPSLREYPGAEADAKWYNVGWVHSVVWVVSLIGIYILQKRKKYRWNLYLLIYFAVAIVGAVFLVHPRSVLIWNLLADWLKYIQFPWRFLMFITFFMSLSVGSIFLWTSTKIKNLIWFSLVLIVVIANFSYFKPEKFVNVSQSDLLSGENWEKQINRSIFDYLPIYAELPPVELAQKDYVVDESLIEINNFEKGTNWIKFNVEVSEPTKIKLSQYYFPEWKVFVDEEQVDIDYSNDLGLITIDVEPGDNLVSVRLYNSWLRSFSNLLTVVGLMVAATLYFKYKKRNK